jgi:AbrB family looped-hinge helix DNA binding protein
VVFACYNTCRFKLFDFCVMKLLKVSKNGQLTLPKSIRDALNITYVGYEELPGGLFVIKPVDNPTALKHKKRTKGKKRRPFTVEDLRKMGGSTGHPKLSRDIDDILYGRRSS